MAGGIFSSMRGYGKRTLRESMTEARRRFPLQARVAAAHSVAARVTALDAFRNARTIGLYASLGSEVDTTEIARAALASGKQTLYPRLRSGELAMEFAPSTPEALRPGPLRALEPAAESESIDPSEIDLILVPGLAFDGLGNRLGRGQGYYDATLARLGHALRLGIAYDFQIVPDVPHEQHDAPVDAIATEIRLLFPNRGSASR